MRHDCYYVIRTAWLSEEFWRNFKRSICFMCCDWVATQSAGLHFTLCHVQSEEGWKKKVFFLFFFSSFSVLPGNSIHGLKRTYSFTIACLFCLRGVLRVFAYPSSLTLGDFLQRSCKERKKKKQFYTQPGDRQQANPAFAWKPTYRGKKNKEWLNLF